MSATVVTGSVAPAFDEVRELFASFFPDRESGAGLAVLHRGRLVVDLHGGWRDEAREQRWTADTRVGVYSVSKPFAAVCLMLLIDRGLVGLDDPVSAHWPEFPDDGTTVRHVLSHTAGRPVFPVERGQEALADWETLVEDLAAAEPLWTPGTTAAEHALTYGHLIGEIVRRVDGRPIGRFLAEEVAGPWALDLGFGAGDGTTPIADLGYGDPDWPTTAPGEPGSLKHASLVNPAGALALDVLNGPLWRHSEVPAVNVHATAPAIARFYAGLLDGGVLDDRRLLREDTVAEFVRVQHDGDDLLLGRPVRWALGVQVEDDGSWGMGGIGGSCGYALPSEGLAIAYVTRHLAGFDRMDELDAAITRAVQA